MSWKTSLGITCSALIACSGSALAADVSQARAGAIVQAAPSTEVALPTVRGTERFLVGDASLTESPALRINDDLAEKDGTIPAPSAGWTLTSRIVVQTTDIESLRNALAARPVQGVNRDIITAAAEWHPSQPGFVVVDAGTIAGASQLALDLAATGDYASVEADLTRPRVLRAVPSDPSFGQQWHLRNSQISIADINAEPAWDNGYTGVGVTLGILEGGFQTGHPDLTNYVSLGSQNGGSQTGHATSCAGVAAAQDNNGRGGVGLAYDADLTNLLYGSNSTTANAFNFRNDINDIKSNSWGPTDNGTLDYISSVEYNAIVNTATNGRGGKGTILAWAAGNGGTGDRVEYDQFAASRHTLAIGAIGDQDVRSWYNETGSSMLVVAHSNGNNRGIYTTTNGSGYTSSFGGTSSACPLGAGAVALMLQANPDLTHRDVVAVLVNSARINDPGNSLWTTNGAGHDINLNYGFGAMDADAMTQLASNWTLLGPEVSFDSGVVDVNRGVPDNNATGIFETFEVTEDITIEAVELIMNVATTYVGDLEIVLTSPDGTESLLSTPRSDAQDNLNNFRFTSLRPFDESSVGTWTIRVSDEGPGDVPTWNNYRLQIFGTSGNGSCSSADLAEPFGTLNFFDLGQFLTLFNAQDPAADVAAPTGVWNFFDLGFFLTQFNAGCP